MKSSRAEATRRLKALQAVQQQVADGGGASAQAAERAQREASEERLRSTLAAKAQLVTDLRCRVRGSSAPVLDMCSLTQIQQRR